jgi:hypothetical protein
MTEPTDTEDQPADDPQDAAAAPDPGTPPINSQIIQAVEQSTRFAFGLEQQLRPPVKDGTRLSSGAAIAYEKAAQAGALAVQDAADYQRNVLSISNVAQAKALATILADESKIVPCAVVFVLAIAGSLAAAMTAGEIGTQVDTMLSKFPRG